MTPHKLGLVALQGGQLLLLEVLHHTLSLFESYHSFLRVNISTTVIGLQCMIGGYSFLLMGYLFILVEFFAIYM